MALSEISEKSREKQIAAFKRQAKAIYTWAKEKGLGKNFFFTSTFHTYQTQIFILQELEEKIRELGATITKEYVKGRPNVCGNPAILDYNKTATAANSTVSTLINIIKAFDKGAPDGEESKLEQFRRYMEE